MSIYNKPDINPKLGNATPTPSYIHKKTNSVNFSPNSGRLIQENTTKISKKKLELNKNQNNNTENNINQNINKLLTSTNRNNKKIEINLNKNYSPITRLNNKTNRENIILLKHKQSTSSNNLNNKNCNIIINNNIDTNPNIKEKYSKNNNINININISKKIIYKQKDKKNLIVVKNNQINSANNSEAKNYQKNNVLNSNIQNIRKNSVNINHSSANEIIQQGNGRKNQENLNKLKKENKSMFLSQIQLPINSPVSPRNVNNIQNFIRLNQAKNSVNKNKKNPINKNNQKLSANNINYIHNNTEYNLYEKINNNISNNEDNYSTYKKTEKNSPKKNIYINRKHSAKNKIFEINVDCPEELHFFYINIFQKGNKINFEKNNH